MSTKIKPYELWGRAQLYEAVGQESLRDEVLSLLEPVLGALVDETSGGGQAGESLLPREDWPALFFALDQTGVERYREAAFCLEKQMTGVLTEMPFYAAFETRYRRKEHYGRIAECFRGKASLSEPELVALADTVDLMSPEIYEHYRELADRLQAELKERIRRETGSCEALETGYAVLKACCMRVLQREKYAWYGLKVWEQAAEGGIYRDQGMKEMLKSQVIRLKNQEGEVYEG